MKSHRIAFLVLVVGLVTAVFVLSWPNPAMEARAEIGATSPKPYMLNNINTTTPSSNPECTVNMGDFMLCVVDDGIHGRELWRSDGTQAGSWLVKDIYDGQESSLDDLHETDNLDGHLFFAARDEAHGRELWKTDGTTAGTKLVKDIHEGPDNTLLFGITAVGERIFFLIFYWDSYPDIGYELWISDGSEEGTVMVKDISPLPGAAANPYYYTPTGFVAMGGNFYYAYDDGEHGMELWRSDGTAPGTHMVKDISTVNDGRYGLSHLTSFGDILYFTTDDSIHGRELWKSDGTEMGTVLVKDINIGTKSSNPWNITMMSNVLYFSATSCCDQGLWRSDGTEAGTVLVTSKPDAVSNMRASGDKLFFLGGGQTLWVSDGTDSGTSQILTYDDSCDYVRSEPFAVPDESSIFICLFFQSSGFELWRSDGTSQGTVMVKDIVPGRYHSEPEPQLIFNDKVYFAASNAGHDRELWMTDGSGEGTIRAMDFNTSAEEGSYPGPFSPLGGDGGQVIFQAYNSEVGTEPIVSDGTESGTAVLKDIVPGPDSSAYWTETRFLKPVTLGDGRIFFASENKDLRTEIWTSDGTEAGTTAVIRTCRERVENLAATDNAAFFTAVIEDQQGGCDYDVALWRTDGTKSGTEEIDNESGTIFGLEANSASLFYQIGDFDLGNKLWSIGELDDEPQQLADHLYGNPVIAGETLFFKRQAPYESGSLWKSDGSPTGTTKLKELSTDISMYSAGEILYFFESSSDGTKALWVTDGTPAGTKLVKDGWSDGVWVYEMAAAGDSTFFILRTAGDDGHYELWRTDGTSDGTKMVKDFPHWKENSPNLAALHDLAFFNADDGMHGHELWVSDGTAQGTQMVADINPAPGEGSNPHEFAARGDTLYFSADDDQHGFEPWAYKPFGDVQAPTADFSATPTRGAPPLTVSFKNLSIGDYDSCIWQFGDGATSNACDDPSHTYTSPGNYQVSLTVSGPGGEDSETKKGYISVEYLKVFLPGVMGNP